MSLLKEVVNSKESIKQKIAKLNSEIENYQRLSNNLKEQKEELDTHILKEKSKLHKEYKDAREEAKKAIKTKVIEDFSQTFKYIAQTCKSNRS